MADIAEKLLQAMQIVANKNLEAISFDTTIEVTIEDISQANQGKYLVSNGASKFYAYSTETNYKLHDAVMVTIPEGKYDNQKIIIGKKVRDNETAIPYRSPFGHIVDVTSNLISGSHERGIYANYNTDIINGSPWDIESKNFDSSDVFTGWLAAEGVINSQGTSELTPEQIAQANDLLNRIPIWDSGEINAPYTGYTRLGLRAQFSTWLSTYNTIRGNYGLCLKVGFQNLDSNDYFYNFYYFDSDSFYGDPYNFETYYTQEAIFDIEEYKDYLIKRLTLFIYQRNNFYDINGELIEAPTEEDGEFSTVLPNIYVKDPFICFGYEDDESITDTAVLFTTSNLTYYKYNEQGTSNRTNNITKSISLRWIHREEGSKELHPMTVVPEGYRIIWYRKKIGAASPDAFAGAHYEIIEQAANQFSYDFVPDVNLQEDAVKVIIVREQDNISSREDNKEVIVVQSNLLTFTNDQTVISQSDITQLSALGIKFEDLQRGHYSIYRRDGKLQRDIDSKQVRYVTAVFDYNEQGLYAKSLLNEADSVTWYYPIKNTMIKPYDKTLQKPSESNIVDGGIYAKWSPSQPSSNYHTITQELSDNSTEDVNCYQFAYTIKSTLNRSYTNNTIRLEVEKDGVVYLADISMTFNVAGSSGSAYTLDILWDDENNVIDISSSNRTISGQIVLYDENGVLIDIPEDAQIYYNWYVTNGSGTVPIINTSNILYPCSSTGTFNEENPYLEEITLGENENYYYFDGTKFLVWDNIAENGNYQKYRYKQDNEQRYIFKYKKANNGQFVLLNDNYVIYESRFNSLLGENFKRYTPQLEAQKIDNNFTITINEDNNIIVSSQNINMDAIGIFELVLTNFGDYDLTALFPIALKNGAQYQGIDGATSVRYSTLGDPDYIRNPYQLFAAAGTGGLEVNEDVTWSILATDSSNTTFLPDLSKKNVLKPLPIYIEKAPDYAVQAKIDNTTVWTQPILVYKDNYPSTTLNKWNGTDILQNDEEGTIVANGIAAGKKENDNTFSGVMIGDWSNSDVDSALTTSTGVYGFNHGAISYAFKDDGTAFIGKDGRGRITFNGSTGVIESAHYGVTNGYGMRLDIDNGALYIKGDSNTNNSSVYLSITTPVEQSQKELIYISNNSYYLQSKDFSSINYTGTKIDLANGRLQGYNFNIQAQNANGGTITIDSTATSWPFVVEGRGYTNYDYGNNSWNYDYNHDRPSGRFAINWDGSIDASGGRFGGEINASGGTIHGTLNVYGSLNVSGSISSNNWGTGSTSGYSLSGNKLTARDADISGTITATGGKIGGWTIGNNSINSYLYAGNTYLFSSGLIYSDNFENDNGVIGYIEGNDGSGSTNLLGISTKNGLGAAIIAPNANIRLSAANIWLDGTVYIKQQDGTYKTLIEMISGS